MLIARKYRSKGKFAIKEAGRGLKLASIRFFTIHPVNFDQFRLYVAPVKRVTKRSTIYEPLRAEQRFHNTVPCYHVSKILFCLRDDAFKSSAPEKLAVRKNDAISTILQNTFYKFCFVNSFSFFFQYRIKSRSKG